MYEGITQQNLKQAVPLAHAFIFLTANLLGAWSFIFPSVVKSHKKPKTNKQTKQKHQKENQRVLLVFWLIFLANIFSTFVSECRLYENSV